MDNYELIAGAIDMHQHSGPDVMKRKIHDFDFAKECEEIGLGGFVIKSHYYCSGERAEMCNRIYPKCQAIGAITLNNSVGGLNPVAVEFAGRSNAKVVWFPTFDSRNERHHLATADPSVVRPYWAKINDEINEAGVKCDEIYLLDENGNLKQEVIDIINIVKRYNMVIATSHISHAEAFAVAKQCHKVGAKLIISHVLYPSTTYTLEEINKFIDLGAYIELCYTTITTKKTTFEATLNILKNIDTNKVIISSDAGNPNGISPVEGMVMFAQWLNQEGFSKEQIQKMNRDNPRYLVGLADE